MARPTAPRIDAAERDAQALELRADGLSFRQLGRQLGCSTTTAYRRVSRGLDRTVREPADRLRALELHRLDQQQAAATAVLRTRHVLIQGGRPVLDQQGRPYPDHGPILAAIATLLRIAERRAKLLGLDAPARVDAHVRGQVYSIDALDEELARVQAELDALGPADPPAAEQHPTGPPAAPMADVGALLAGALEVALDAADVPEGDRRREAAYAAVERQLRKVADR
jgi:hypothetical protein